MIKNYVVAFVIFFALDMVWLGLVAKDFYSRHLGLLMKTNINWPAAIIFYMLFIAGLVVFVINPSIEKRSLVSALMLGAFFGLVAYSTYDLTNLATVKNWPMALSIVDLLWGTFLGAVVSCATYLISVRWL